MNSEDLNRTLIGGDGRWLKTTFTLLRGFKPGEKSGDCSASSCECRSLIHELVEVATSVLPSIANQSLYIEA